MLSCMNGSREITIVYQASCQANNCPRKACLSPPMHVVCIESTLTTTEYHIHLPCTFEVIPIPMVETVMWWVGPGAGSDVWGVRVTS